jgi:hypothetical protein
MTIKEKTLLLAVADGLYKLLTERLNSRHGAGNVGYSEAEVFGPFKALIDAVKEENDEGNA